MNITRKHYEDEMGYESTTLLDEKARILYFKNNKNLEYAVNYDKDGKPHRTYIDNHCGIDTETMNWGFKMSRA